jgi:hypothetical protein
MRPLTDFLAIFTGPAIWAGHFLALYAAHTLTCLNGDAAVGANIFGWASLAVTLPALIGLVVLVLRPGVMMRAPSTHLADITRLLAGLSLLAVIWVAFAGLAIRSCAA